MHSFSGLLLTAWMVVSYISARQIETPIGSLQTTDGLVLALLEGNLVLVRPGTERDTEITRGWSISAPHVRAPKGMYLACEQSEAGVKLLLAENPDDNAKWVVEITGRGEPRPFRVARGASGPALREGNESQTFRLAVYAGKHKGKYLALKPPPADAAAEEVTRELQVVENPKEALKFEYVRASYRVTIRSK